MEKWLKIFHNNKVWQFKFNYLAIWHFFLLEKDFRSHYYSKYLAFIELRQFKFSLNLQSWYKVIFITWIAV